MHFSDTRRAARSIRTVTLALLILFLAPPGHADDRNALWHIVHDLCVPDMKLNGFPEPCSAVNLQRGFAVLKDIRGATQFLLIPTDAVSGVEDPKLLAAAAPNYWQDAWDMRSFFEKATARPVPRDDIGMAINSVYGRSQDQLHIHVDCVRRIVKKTLREQAGQLGPHWSDLSIQYVRHRYRVMQISDTELRTRDPFKLLPSDPQAATDRRGVTLVVVGSFDASGKPVFTLLSDRADPSTDDRGHGEELLDHACKVLLPSEASSH